MKNLGLEFMALIVAVQVHAGDLGPLKTKAANLTILADQNEMTLYVFDRDTENTSNCNDGCSQVWPALSAPEGELPGNFSVVTRADGSKQLAFKKRPLYFYAGDAQPGDLKGDGLGGIWHVVHP